jgi:hypothetical protein
MSESIITIELNRDAALVLFELLADFKASSSLALPEAADSIALLRLHGALESTLTEPFRPEYRDLLFAAKRRLSERFGVT